jgi:hypothetical protein
MVDRLRHQLLAGAALAEDEDVRARRGGQTDEVEDLRHRLRLADDVVEAVAPRQLGAQLAVLAAQLALFEAAADGEQHFLVLERLGDVVESALAHRLDRAFDRRECGDHHHHLLGVLAPDLAQRLLAAHPGQHQVEEHEIDFLALEDLESLLAALRVERMMAVAAEQRGEDVLEDFLVVDDQDVHGAQGARCLGSSTVNSAPPRGSFSARRLPPWRSTIDWLMASPSPVPPVPSWW